MNYIKNKDTGQWRHCHSHISREIFALQRNMLQMRLVTPASASVPATLPARQIAAAPRLPRPIDFRPLSQMRQTSFQESAILQMSKNVKLESRSHVFSLESSVSMIFALGMFNMVV